jgi:kynureninase
LITINPPESYAVSRELLARNIKIDYRENAGIRIAPHFYNSDDECREVVAVIAEILEDGSWKQHTESRDFVT